MLVTSILQEKRYNIAGPLCFSGDVVKYNALLPEVCFHSIFSFMQLIKCNAFNFTYIERILHGWENIWILCSSEKNNIPRVNAANESDIVLATRTYKSMSLS